MAASSADFLKQINQLTKAVEHLQGELGPQGPTLVRAVTNGITNLRNIGQAIATQAEQLTGLMETAELLNSSLEIQPTLEAVIDTIIRLTGAERAFIVLADGDELTMRIARNWDQESVPKGDATFSRSIVRAALEGNEAILTTNAQTDARFGQALSISAGSLRSVLCVPLLSRRKAIGVIYADNRIMAGVFDQDTVSLVTTFAHQAAIAIDNAQQFQQVRAELENAQKSLEVLRVQIDESQRKRQFEEITETDYFKRLEQQARAQRALARSAAEQTD